MNQRKIFKCILCRIKDKLLASLLCTQNRTNKSEEGISLHLVIIFLLEFEMMVLVYHFKMSFTKDSEYLSYYF